MDSNLDLPQICHNLKKQSHTFKQHLSQSNQFKDKDLKSYSFQRESLAAWAQKHHLHHQASFLLSSLILFDHHCKQKPIKKSLIIKDLQKIEQAINCML